MKDIYIAIEIIYHTGLYKSVECKLWEVIDNGKAVGRTVSHADACKMMWALQKAGGTRAYRTNQFDNSIAYSEVSYWARH